MKGWTITKDSLGLGIMGACSAGDTAAAVIEGAGLIRAFKLTLDGETIAMGKGNATAALTWAREKLETPTIGASTWRAGTIEWVPMI